MSKLCQIPGRKQEISVTDISSGSPDTSWYYPGYLFSFIPGIDPETRICMHRMY